MARTATTQYSEVVRPGPWIWLLAASFAAALGIAYGYAYHGATGWIVAGATAVVLGLLIGTMWRTPLQVDADGFRAGRAVLPGQWIGRVAPLDREQAFRARTTDADARAFLMLSTWATSLAVVVEVIDPDDPHPYWLVSTRRPQELAAAVVALRDGVRLDV
jgi:hypothetical protein